MVCVAPKWRVIETTTCTRILQQPTELQAKFLKMSIKTVAVAGAAGSMGTPLVKELIKNGFSVTALTRSDSSNFPSEVEVERVDYNDLRSLTEALKSQDAVVSTITTAGVESQKNLIDAAIAAKVQRFIVS